MKQIHEHECGCGHAHEDDECRPGHARNHDCSHDDCECNDPACGCDDDDKEHLHQPSKYDAALARYDIRLDDAEVTKAVDAIIEARIAANNTKEVKERLLSCLDLTSLHATDNDESILRLVERVNAFDNAHPDLPHVAALCTYPLFSGLVSQSLEADRVEVAAVSGGFPSSQTFTEVKVAETALAVADGADEIDIVINVGNFLAGNYEEMCQEIEELKQACKESHLKVILESGALKTASNIKKASLLSIYSGADFIKTSTGKTEPAATLEAAYVMCQAIKEYYEQTGTMIGFKPAGGISKTVDAVKYYCVVKEVLGEKWLTNEHFRIGASRLANNLLTDIWGTPTKFF